MNDIVSLINEKREMLKLRESGANKGTYRKLLVIAGSSGMAGAAYLCSLAAFRTGIGMVKILGPECNRSILQTKLPEAMYSVCENVNGMPDKDVLTESIDWADYILIGPGLSKNNYAKGLIRHMYSASVKELLSKKELIIIDADALNIIAEEERDPGALSRYTVITPHVGEMSRLTGLSISEIKKNVEATAAEYSKKHGITVVLKDAVSIVAESSGDIYGITSGCSAMAKAGSGDVLCGFIAGTSAVLKGDLSASIPIAVFLHGKAGSIAAEENGCHSILASDIADAAGEAINSI